MRHFWLFALFMLPASVAHAQASFDCSLAATPVEVTICASDNLSRLDRQLAVAYRAARAVASQNHSDQIRADQRAWIDRRNACGADPDCLARLLRDRIASLISPVPASTEGLTGLYCNDTGVMGLQEQGSSLRFDFMFFFGDFSCGTPTLIVQRSGVGWTSLNNGCRLTLTHEGGDMVVRTDTVAACQATYCGARAAITEFRMPLRGKMLGISDPFIDGIGERQCR